ncbi:MAG TPA: APH(3') family aminoglycoside O-phosphotransferase [Ktedonobacterales bacterium]|nr:APH(3') family aminoglycoside O-phosphotransferase [Ktedonobacterales bacterium]
MTHGPNPIDSLPSEMRAALGGAEWQAVTIGMSGADVARLVTPGQPSRYLKLAHGPRVVELRAERDRLRWLHPRLPVPAVLGWAEREGEGAEQTAWLLLSEVPGRMACDPTMAADPARVVRLLAEGLWRMHQLSVAECPFDARLDQRLANAWWNIGAGLADEAAVRVDHSVSAAALLARLVATRPNEPPADLVVTHGDYCLPNVLLDPADERVIGYLDLGRAGVADRYQDLAIGARSVRYNLGEPWGQRFLDTYVSVSGVGPLDPERLEWYELLDEVF